MSAPTSTPTELVAAFQAFATAAFEDSGLPGASLGVILQGEEHLLNFGVTSTENPLPVTEDTLFQIGSTTKTLTSLTVSVLEHEGLLTLSDRVRDHLPDFKLQDAAAAEQITIRDLLTHQGGFQGDLFEDTGHGDDALEKVLDRLAEAPQVVPLRGHWSYNNAGFYVAGRVIEQVTGQSYEAAVTERVFKPLGMNHSFFFAGEVMTHRFAAGHNKVGDGWQVQRPGMMMRSGAPAGSTCTSSVQDMLRYARYLLHGTVEQPGDAAAPSSLTALDRARLWTPLRTIGVSMNGFPGTRGQMAQSWFVDAQPAATIVSHGGTTLGHQSEFWFSPDQGVAVAMMTNGNTGHTLNRRLGEWLKREALNLSAPEHSSVPMAAAALGELAGAYSVVGTEATLPLTLNGDVLSLHFPDASGGAAAVPLRFIAPDVALLTEGDAQGFAVEFLRHASGHVEFIRFGGRLYPRGGMPA